MISYERFKNAVRTDLKKYLPEEYAAHKLVEKKLYKINRCVDTFRLQPPGPAADHGPMATLNYQDMYRSIVGGAKLETVLQSIARLLQFRMPPGVEADSLLLQESKPDKESIHLALINHKRNRQLLKNVPHQDFLDLAAIAVLEQGPGSGYLCVVTNDILKDLDMDQEELLKTACDNTFHAYPAILEESQLGLNAWCEGSTFGAVCLLDKQLLRDAAEQLDSDLYVLPDSLHLLFLVAVKSVPRAIILDTFRQATLLEPDALDYLSDNVYYYDRRQDSLKILRDHSKLPS
ncbi:MAG: hypothetical protein IKW92_09230 [Firmicutes bacterium]|nr:hypothetical protein [Bacillota bacterium]